MVNEIKRRYFNREILVWTAAGVATELIILTYIVYVRINYGHTEGKMCAVDMLALVSNNFLFPFLMLMSALCNQRMMKCDRDPMIILKYSSRQGIYFWQTVSTLVYSAVESVLYVVIALIYGGIHFKVLYNWDKDYSYFAGCSNGSTLSIPVEYVIILYMILMTVLMMSTCMLGIALEIISDSDIVSGVAIIILAGIDIFRKMTYSRLVLFETSWLHMDMCIRKMCISLGILAVLVVAGYFLQRRREYYEYKKENE